VLTFSVRITESLLVQLLNVLRYVLFRAYNSSVIIPTVVETR